MSRGWKRYGEARLYAISGSVALLAVIWAVLFTQDQQAEDQLPASDSRGEIATRVASSVSPHTTTRGS